MTGQHADILDFDAGPLAEKIGEWASDVLGPYIKRYSQNPHREPKLVHDPIGKAVTLQTWEVYIMDSPLLQRLRFIRQLGVGHFLFPTSGYSRFEHSLGCVQAAATIFDAVSEAGNPPIKYTGDELAARREVVRLAALLHDIGHAILSHVSEKFYAQDPELIVAQKRLRAYYQNNVAPAEVVAILVLRSKAFQQLLAASTMRRTVFTDREIIDKVCSCIAGSKARMIPDSYLAEIVNGPVDCDKLDYLSRDAHMAGVPISLDIDRLCSKLRIVHTATDDSKPIYSLAIVPSGARALEEMLVSRIFLYDKFYYHPKVMAAEELVRRALGYLKAAYPSFQSPRTLLEYGDDEFLSLSAKYIADRYGIAAGDENLQRGCDLLARARARDLPKRAFAFARRFIPEAPEGYSRFVNGGRAEGEPQAVLEFIHVDRLLENPGGPEMHARKIEALLGELGMDTEVFIGYQSAKRAAGKMDMPVKLSDSEVDPTPDFLFNVSKWSEAYALNKQTSYVFAYESLPQVHLAAERFFAERGMTFAPKCWIFSKLTSDRLTAARSGLPETDKWIPHRLSPDFLNSPGAQRRISELRSKFASFLNSFDRVLGPALLDSWIWQFGDADLQDNAMALLEYITFVEKSDIVEGFQKLAARRPELREAVWVPLRPRTGEGTSADLIRYDLKGLDVRMSEIAALTPADIEISRRVVFFDDLLNSGAQTECLLGSWFVGNEARCERERDRDPKGLLPEDLRSALQGAEIDFVFYSTSPLGIQRVKRICRDIGLSLNDVSGWVDASDPRYTLEGFEGTSSKSKKRLIDFLQRKGQQLLKEKHKGKARWNDEQIEKFALGYGGLEMTLLYRHSVSTALPVALWQHSTSLSTPWLALFPRKSAELRNLLDPSPPQSESTRLPEYLGA